VGTDAGATTLAFFDETAGDVFMRLEKYRKIRASVFLHWGLQAMHARAGKSWHPSQLLSTPPRLFTQAPEMRHLPPARKRQE
jgi:hypothetical protein